MNARQTLAAAALLGGLGVAFGAFGAHALHERLPAERLAVFETAARYQLLHALALLGAAGLLARLPRGERAAGWIARAATAWVLGVVLFGGSLHALAVTGRRWLGAVTPLGGAAFLAGWACLFRAARCWRLPPADRDRPR